MNTHTLSRTSPKGEPFIGTCVQCGKRNLPARAIAWSCRNVANLTQQEALMVAIEGPSSIKDQGNG